MSKPSRRRASLAALVAVAVIAIAGAAVVMLTREAPVAVARVAGAFPASFQGASDHTVSNAFYFGDPEGNGVELYVDMPRDTWTWVDGQVTMGTFALDPNAFLQEHLPPAGPSAQATGVTMGHVHLRGGDTGVAERFYVDVIGMAVTSRIDSAVFLSGGGARTRRGRGCRAHR